MTKYHNNTKLFKEAIITTAKASGFRIDLVEKDYFCSLVLSHLFSFGDTALIFKGGTCLSKVYTDFYRMSEDLDFTIPTPLGTSRTLRRNSINNFKQRVSDISKTLPVFKVSREPRGANVSTQYIAEVSYTSVVSGDTGNIKIEVGLREPIINEAVVKDAKTLLYDPFTDKSVVPPIPVKCFSVKELYAEKIRAALTRLTPAIRDIYDLDYALQNNIIDITDKRLLELMQQKLVAKGTGKINVSDSRKQELLFQVDTELKSVLRKKDYDSFNFERAYNLLMQIAQLAIS